MKVYDALRKKTWSWSFTTRKDAEEAIKKGHPHSTEHLVVLEPGEEFETTFIDFGDFCRSELGMQSQYGYHALVSIGGYAKREIGKDIRYVNPHGGYHAVKIHKDDALIFKERMGVKVE